MSTSVYRWLIPTGLTITGVGMLILGLIAYQTHLEDDEA